MDIMPAHSLGDCENIIPFASDTNIIPFASATYASKDVGLVRYSLSICVRMLILDRT